MRDRAGTRHAVIWWGAVVVWMAAIFGVSGVPGAEIPLSGGWGSFGHFAAYALLGALLLGALGRPERLVTAIAIASTYGLTDELHQLFVPGRMCDPVDWLVDTLGAIVGAYLMTRAYRAVQTRRARRP